MTADKIATNRITPLRTTDSAGSAMLQMEELHISGLPVVSGEEYLGVISDSEVQGSEDPGCEVGTLRLEPHVITASPDQHLLEVLNLFAASDLTMLPVVGDNNRYAGAIMLRDIVRKTAELAGTDRKGSIIVLEAGERDHSLAGIIQVVEANGAQVLNVFVTPVPVTSRILITIKVDRIEIGPLLQAFFRLNYSVAGSWSEQDTYTEGLRDRYDALMNYLSI